MVNAGGVSAITILWPWWNHRGLLEFERTLKADVVLSQLDIIMIPILLIRKLRFLSDVSAQDDSGWK